MSQAFEPVFCPNCGTCVNEPEEEQLLPERAGPTGLLINCGWCKRRHSIEEVKACRRLAYLSDDQRLQGIKKALLNRRSQLVDE